MSVAVDDGSSPGRNSSAVNVTCLALWHTDRIDEKQRFLSVSSDENVIHECRKSQWSYYITVSTAPGHHHLNAREIRWWTVSTINVFFLKNHSAYLFLLMLSWAPLHSWLFTAVNRSAVVANWSPECVWSEPDIRTSGSSSTCSTRQTEQAVLLKTWRFDVASSIRSSPSPPTLKESIFLFWTPPHIRLIVPLHGWCPISRILWPVLALQSWSFQSGQSARFSRYPQF